MRRMITTARSGNGPKEPGPGRGQFVVQSRPHRRDFDPPYLREGQREINILRRPAPAVGQERLGGLESLGRFWNATEGLSFAPPDGEIPVDQLAAFARSHPGCNARAPWGDRRAPREIRA
jgi:hypothetical protein